MNWPAHCAVVIPCLNESATIGRVVREVREHLPAVLVVDDGSSDRTADEARSAGAQVIVHLAPRGKGAALCAGWCRARELGFRWVLSMDGDGQHAASDIPAFLGCAERTGAVLVVGNRMARPAGMPWVRRQVNRWMSRRLSALSGRFLPDTQNGFRLMDLGCWQLAGIGASHFEIESEVLLQFVQQGLRVEFVPVTVIYQNERSKIDPWKDTLRWLRWRRRAARRQEGRRRDT